ncbi:hypothetical protein GCM10010168_54050 [Actinoplanes ianthinogenes]|uniref:Uncharacterized protein n=1 Tax=Actinoplanes ianthinogenes TaxID=122358 RepID=A0ABM7LQR8_9ACTN|nr:hypothetical protein Aiant_22540 [Actinoplanes ianthinogenes]GGR29039.1 hypothetical protein GCM10010168_54050 [Actinoplanes ianthinogenes]
MFPPIPSGSPARLPHVPIAAAGGVQAWWEAGTPWPPPTAYQLDEESLCPLIAGQRSVGRPPGGAAPELTGGNRHAPSPPGCFRWLSAWPCSASAVWSAPA